MKTDSFSEILKMNVIKPYNKIVDVYVQKHFHEEIFIPILEKFSKMLSGKANILDIGCGPGGETQHLLNQGFNVVSIDVSEEMLKKARKLVPSGKFINMNLLKMDFDDNTFDAIWSARTLIHIPSKLMGKALKEMKRVLNVGGIVCLTVLVGKGQGIEPEYYDETHSTYTFFHYFGQEELQRELEKNGFEIIGTEKSYLGEDREEHLTVFAKLK